MAPYGRALTTTHRAQKEIERKEKDKCRFSD